MLRTVQFHEPAEGAMFTLLCLEEEKRSGFPVKTNMKGITESSLGLFSRVVCNAASLPPR